MERDECAVAVFSRELRARIEDIPTGALCAGKVAIGFSYLAQSPSDLP